MSLPLLRRIQGFTHTLDRDELEARYEKLVFLGHPGLDFFVLTTTSAAIAAAGFQMNSPSVIIGAMVLSPLLYPVVLMGSALSRRDLENALSLAGMSVLGVVLGLAVAAAFGWASPGFSYGTEISSRLTSSPALYVLVAVASGIAGTLAYYWPDISESIMGVSISVALMPPVVMMGLGIGRGDGELFLRSSVIVALNVAGLVLAAAATTRFLWWYSIKSP